MSSYIWKKINMLTIVSKNWDYFICKCDCWNECKKSVWNICTNKWCFSCWCKRKKRACNKKRKVSVWDINWKIKIVALVDSCSNIICECDCWNNITIRDSLFKKRKSCWCYKWKAWWESRTPFYWIWREMVQRCTNINNKSYKVYGVLWIDERWVVYQNFKKDMYHTYQIHLKKFWRWNTSIDRINNNLWYSRNNCRWATKKEQSRNRSNTFLLWWKTIKEISIETGKSYTWLWRIINNMKKNIYCEE